MRHVQDLNPLQEITMRPHPPGESMRLLLKVENDGKYDFYDVALRTSGYRESNSQETDNIFHGYNYTNVLDALKKWPVFLIQIRDFCSTYI